MKKYSRVIYLILIMGLPVSLNAQTDLSNLIKQTLSSNPQLKEQSQRVEIASYNTQMVKSQYLPQVSLDGLYNYVYPVPEVQLALPGLEGGGFTLQPQNNYQTAITVNQLLYDFGKTSSQMQKSRVEQDLSRKGLENANLQVAYQIAQLYFNAVF